MSGRGKHYGPLHWKCPCCRGGIKSVARLTGKSRPVKIVGGGLRQLPRAVQYVCGCCHVGWSKHSSFRSLVVDYAVFASMGRA